MAILEQGLIGTFRGKMGSIVITKWKDCFVGKGKPKKSSKLATEKQIIQRSKFKLAGAFLASVSEVLSIGFKGGKNTTPMNEAMRYNLKNSISGDYPNYTLDYNKIRFSESRGKINYARDPIVAAIPGSSIKLSWGLEERPLPSTKATDVIYAIVYHPLNDLYQIEMPVRNKLSLEIDLPRLFIGEVHCWVFVASDNGMFSTPTQYLGKVTVIA